MYDYGVGGTTFTIQSRPLTYETIRYCGVWEHARVRSSFLQCYDIIHYQPHID